MTRRNLHSFRDIHSHRLADAATGDSVVNIDAGSPLPPSGFFSVGIHPWSTATGSPSLASLRALISAARDCRVVAIGECGFDRLRGGDIALQQRVFDFQARLASRLGIPLIIHAVKADDLLIDAIRRHRPAVPWIIHGFRGKPARARALLSHGFSLSLGDRFNPDSLAVIPPDRLYRESDAT